MDNDYNPHEMDEVQAIFAEMLASATRDGGNKRASGSKPPWRVDPSHETALFSHLYKWKRGDLVDADSGVHPLIHMAWRALAIAWQESHGITRAAMEIGLRYPTEQNITISMYDC